MIYGGWRSCGRVVALDFEIPHLLVTFTVLYTLPIGSHYGLYCFHQRPDDIIVTVKMAKIVHLMTANNIRDVSPFLRQGPLPG